MSEENIKMKKRLERYIIFSSSSEEVSIETIEKYLNREIGERVVYKYKNIPAICVEMLPETCNRIEEKYRGKVIEEAEIIDVIPTIADILKVPYECQGRSLFKYKMH